MELCGLDEARTNCDQEINSVSHKSAAFHWFFSESLQPHTVRLQRHFVVTPLLHHTTNAEVAKYVWPRAKIHLST